jgi:hypothetical protein
VVLHPTLSILELEGCSPPDQKSHGLALPFDELTQEVANGGCFTQIVPLGELFIEGGDPLRVGDRPHVEVLTHPL